MLTALVLATLLSQAIADDVCTAAKRLAGLCPTIENTGSSVDISGTQHRGGQEGVDREFDGLIPPGSRRTADDEDEPCVIDTPLNRPCTGMIVVSLSDDLAALTLSDLASFAPGATVLAAEPDGVGLVGAPTNFVAPAAQHTATGELFDLPVTVRFTPASFLFDYGDGTTREATTGGTSWSALGQPQFTATATSHAYAARGTYTTSATVRYTAAVDFGAGWIAVPGVLQIPSAPAAIEIFELRTALVAHTCLEDPAGPGC